MNKLNGVAILAKLKADQKGIVYESEDAANYIGYKLEV